MIGCYLKGEEDGSFLDKFLVPFNFLIYDKKEGGTKIIYKPSILEDLTLNLINNREELEECIEEGIIEIINVNDDFLREFRELVRKKQDEKACYKLLGLFEFIKVIKSDDEYKEFGDYNINDYNPLLDKDGYDYPEFFEE